jgi:hypothetical protein
MFTMFSLRDNKPTGIKRIFNIFRKDRIFEEYIDAGSLTVRSITYVNNRKQVNWDAVYSCAGYEAKSLVCSESLRFPYGTGLIRFNDNSLNERLTENFAYGVLQQMENPEKLNIVFYDVEGSHSDFIKILCKFTDNFIVATGNKERYSHIAQKLMEEQGVSLVVTNKLSRIKDSKFVIAPSKIKKSFDIGTKGIVLTSQIPTCEIKAQCYTGYKIEMPQKYKVLLKDDIDEMYLLSCLYSRGRQHSLGSIIPKVAYNSYETCTVKSLAKYLNKVCLT